MSSAGGQRGGGAATQRYFCHQCERSVTLTSSPTSELACPVCHGGFLEEIEIRNPNPLFAFPDTFSSSSSSTLPNLPFFFSASGDPASTVDIHQDLFGIPGFEPQPLRAPSSDHPDSFDPMQFLAGYLQTLMAGGANIQFVVENAPSSDFRFPPSGSLGLGDYFIGPGLEQLIQHLAENDPNRYGTPPASKSAVETLPDIKISRELLASDEAQCAVCKDTFEIDTEAKLMPCKHIYHKECILPWLDLHNSCPVCRYELPTDDPDYENRIRGSQPDPGGVATGAATEVVAQEGNSPGARVAERSFSVALPWPLSALRAFTEGENRGGSGGDTGASSGSADTNSDGKGDRDLGSENHQRDTD